MMTPAFCCDSKMARRVSCCARKLPAVRRTTCASVSIWKRSQPFAATSSLTFGESLAASSPQVAIPMYGTGCAASDLWHKQWKVRDSARAG